MKKILILQGHPDSSAKHYCHSVEEKYVSAAKAAKHSIRQINIAELDFSLLKSKDDYDNGEPDKVIKLAQKDILWADHLVLIFPLWLGDMPALVKGFFEQVFRKSFTFKEAQADKPYTKLLQGKSARVIVTMGMPAVYYRWFYKAHSVKSLERNILSYCGFSPVSATLIGSVYDGKEGKLKMNLSKIARMGNMAQ